MRRPRIAGHASAVDQMTTTVNEHIAKLDEHTAKLDEHGDALKTLVTGQAAIMKHFGITPDNGDASQN